MTAATRGQWERSVAETLSKGRPEPLAPEAALGRLTTIDEDGLSLSPLYDADPDSNSISDSTSRGGVPGQAPFRRGRTPRSNRDGWDVRQIVAPGSETGADELARGATSLWIPFPDDTGVDTATALGTALGGVHLGMAPVIVSGGPFGVAAEALLTAWSDADIAASERRGGLGFDPVTAAVLGRSDGAGDLGPWWARRQTEAPDVTLITIDGPAYRAAGATTVQQLGAVVAAGIDTLRRLEAAGAEPAQAFGAIELRLAVNADQFTTIASIRALRTMWARVAAIAGDTDWAASTPIHAVTDPMAMTRYDAWVNALRSTIACFGAAVAGADAITVVAHDVHRPDAGTELGRRIARNTQLILDQESHVADVIDPAGGSFYVEARTRDLAQAAWAFVQRCERAGGIAQGGAELAEAFESSRQARAERVATRTQAFTGVTEFPDVAERLPGGGGDERRYTAAVEALRGRSADDSAPAVHLATLGTEASAGARLGFARNFFGVAGLAATAGPPTTDPDELVAAVGDERVICVCGADATYDEHGAGAVTALRAAFGDRTILLAGHPKRSLAAIQAAGLDGTIAVGSDLLDVLTPVVAGSVQS